jgi:hypothetical protein
MNPDDLTPDERARIERKSTETREKLLDRLVASGWASSSVFIERKRTDIKWTQKGIDKFALIARVFLELGYAPESMTAEDGRAFGELAQSLLRAMYPPQEMPPSEDLL